MDFSRLFKTRGKENGTNVPNAELRAAEAEVLRSTKLPWNMLLDSQTTEAFQIKAMRFTLKHVVTSLKNILDLQGIPWSDIPVIIEDFYCHLFGFPMENPRNISILEKALKNISPQLPNWHYLVEYHLKRLEPHIERALKEGADFSSVEKWRYAETIGASPDLSWEALTELSKQQKDPRFSSFNLESTPNDTAYPIIIKVSYTPSADHRWNTVDPIEQEVDEEISRTLAIAEQAANAAGSKIFVVEDVIETETSGGERTRRIRIKTDRVQAVAAIISKLRNSDDEDIEH